jgi:ATP-dependent Clp protease protease subunit
MHEIWYSLVGDITQDTAKQLIAWVNEKAYGNQLKTLKLFLSSEGGDVESALMIYHFIKSLPFETEITAFGKVGSAANIILVSSNKRSATQGCIFVLHEGTSTIHNTTASFHQHEDSMLWIKDRIARHVQVLATETGKQKEDIENAMAKTVFLNTEEAVDFGLIREIVESLPMSIAA